MMRKAAEILASRSLQAIPLSIGQGGRKQRLISHVLDALRISNNELRTLEISPGSALSLDLSKPNQRLLYFAFRNVQRYFKTEGLYAALCEIPFKQRGTFFDIGANLGIWSIVAGNLGFDSVCIEPDPEHFSYLSRNKHLFHSIHQIALSDRAGRVNFYRYHQQPGHNSLVKSADGIVRDETIEVDTASLDEFSTMIPLRNPISAVKIDVEGNEAKTVNGLLEFLAVNDRPPVWCEVRGTGSPQTTATDGIVVDSLSTLGYEPMVFVNKRFVDYRPALHRTNIYDIYFVAAD
jgi:FkbM family methyltransferase